MGSPPLTVCPSRLISLFNFCTCLSSVNSEILLNISRYGIFVNSFNYWILIYSVPLFVHQYLNSISHDSSSSSNYYNSILTGSYELGVFLSNFLSAYLLSRCTDHKRPFFIVIAISFAFVVFSILFQYCDNIGLSIFLYFLSGFLDICSYLSFFSVVLTFSTCPPPVRATENNNSLSTSDIGNSS